MPAFGSNLDGLPQILYNHAIGLFTAFGLFDYSEDEKAITRNVVTDSRPAELAQPKMIIPSWLSFCMGVEFLLKAILLRNEVLAIVKNDIQHRRKNLKRGGANYDAVCRVYHFISHEYHVITANQWTWLRNQLTRLKIQHAHELNLGTMGRCIEKLPQLEERKVITKAENEYLCNGLMLLADVRRNSYVHTFYGITVNGNINNDIDQVYVPMINLLLKVYSRGRETGEKTMSGSNLAERDNEG